MLVRVQVGQCTARSATFRIVCVIHTSAKIRVVERLVLAGQPEDVTHFLAHHQLPPWCVIVKVLCVVEIVNLYVAFGDLLAFGDIDPGHSQPIVIAVVVVADRDCSRIGCAVQVVGSAARADRIVDDA